MLSLTIDIGNTNTKIELWDDQGYVGSFTKEELESEEAQSLLKGNLPDGIIVCSVKKEEEEFIEAVKKKFDCIFVNFDQQEMKSLSHVSHYKGPLGPDRMAAFIGAEYLSPQRAKLIADAGTALTLDVANEKGEYCGGEISLGLNSRLKALANATSKLPELEGIREYVSVGRNTAEAIEAGAFNGVVGEIIFAMRRMRDRYKGEITYITGGDGKRIYDVVKRYETGCRFVARLVTGGLNVYIRKKYFKQDFFSLNGI